MKDSESLTVQDTCVVGAILRLGRARSGSLERHAAVSLAILRLPSFACWEIVPLGYYPAVSPREVLRWCVVECGCKGVRLAGSMRLSGQSPPAVAHPVEAANAPPRLSRSVPPRLSRSTPHVYQDRLHRDRLHQDRLHQDRCVTCQSTHGKVQKFTSSFGYHHWVSHGQPQQPGRINVTPLPCRLARHFPLDVLPDEQLLRACVAPPVRLV
jgi:hypothetical protein